MLASTKHDILIQPTPPLQCNVATPNEDHMIAMCLTWHQARHNPPSI